MKVRARYIYGAVVALALLLVSGAISFERSLAQLLNEMHRASETNSQLLLLGAVLSDVKDVERGSDGYVITRDEEFLRPYDRGTRALAADSAAVSRSLIKAPSRSAEFARAEKDADAYLTLSRRIVGLASDPASSRATEVIASRAQLALAEEIEARVTGIRRDELDELIAEQRMVRAETREAALGGLLALAMTGVLLAFVILATRREMLRRTGCPQCSCRSQRAAGRAGRRTASPFGGEPAAGRVERDAARQ
jgi:CHASE3 domain sensor protein